MVFFSHPDRFTTYGFCPYLKSKVRLPERLCASGTEAGGDLFLEVGRTDGVDGGALRA